MRLIGTLNDEQKALIFSLFLQQKGIHHQLEIVKNKDWGSPEYGSSSCKIWIYDEDQFPEALNWYTFYQKHPEDLQFKTSNHSLIQEPPHTVSPFVKEELSQKEDMVSPKGMTLEEQPLGPITRLLLMTCAALLFLSYFYTPLSSSHTDSATLITSPIDQALLYDYPEKYLLIQRFYEVYGEEGLANPEYLPSEGKQLLQHIYQTHFWQGFYPILQKQGWNAFKSIPLTEPMFEKIRQGEWWRLFTPALLHADFFHLFFNMLWIIILGKQLEQRLKPIRYMVLILLLGIFSNTAQYLMTGPNFMGFSGVLCGMLTFIWMRQQFAPWEGYQLDRMTITFMLLFILSMALIDGMIFLIGASEDSVISINLANTAHLSGAFLGVILGGLNAFSWRPD
jgi:GlpG protein